MPPQPSPYRKIIIVLIIIVILVGAFFGIKFYQAAKNNSDLAGTGGPNGRTPFQTRPGTPDEQPQINIDGGVVDPGFKDVGSGTSNVKQRLVQLWNQPVSGFDFIYKDIEVTSTSTINQPVSVASNVAPTSSSTATGTKIFSVDEKPVTPTTVYKKTILRNQEFVYLWDRGTGHIYENLSSSTIVARIANNTLPRIEEAFFFDGVTAIARGVAADNETMLSRYISLFKESATSTIFSTNIRGINLASKHVSILPETKKVFYFAPNSGRGFIMNPDGSGQTSILSTSLTELLPQYVNKATVALTTKPSAYFPGYLFFVNTNGSGNNQYILGDKYGLTTLVSPDGQKILYSEILNNQLETSIYNVKTKDSTLLSQATIADKCAWDSGSVVVYCAIPQRLPNAPYPDDWYQNKTTFSDNIWSINSETGEFNLTVALQDQLTTPIDAFNLKTSKNKKYLLFQDKYSLTLWKYEL